MNPRIYDKRDNRFILPVDPHDVPPPSLTKFFLQFTAALSFLAVCAVAGFVMGGAPVQCVTIASVVKIAGLCEAPREIRMVKP